MGESTRVDGVFVLGIGYQTTFWPRGSALLLYRRWNPLDVLSQERSVILQHRNREHGGVDGVNKAAAKQACTSHHESPHSPGTVQASLYLSWVHQSAR